MELTCVEIIIILLGVVKQHVRFIIVFFYKTSMTSIKFKMRNSCWLIIILIIAGFSMCQAATDNYIFNRSKIQIEGKLAPFEPTIDISEIGLQKYIVNIYLHATAEAAPPVFHLKVKFPRNKIEQLWSSKTWSNKSYFTVPAYDRAAAGFSIISGLTINDQNQITFSCKDMYNARFVSSYIQEKKDTMEFCLGFFEDNPPVSNMQEYQAQVLVDFRNIPFSTAIYEASSWFLEDKFKHAKVSADTTKVPVFSTWYPMHRNIPLENIERELDSLRSFNFKSVLVDDGWRSLVKMKLDTAYAYEASSFATMKSFRQKVDDMNLHLYLWYSIPFMGGNPMELKRFDGKYIHYRAPRQITVLDPRYQEVRQYLTSTYAHFMSEWNFDGYWFDFLNGFYPTEGDLLNEDKGRDLANIQLAVDTLKKEMAARLLKINPDVFMGQEFPVVGPNRSSYESFLSGFVGADNLQIVREKMVNNKLLYGKYTPFMEVVAFNPKDKVEDVARKIQAVLFGNPYLSFFNTTLPAESKQAIRFWLKYWSSNYDVLFDGTFKPVQVSRFYPVVISRNARKSIYVQYEDYTLNFPDIWTQPTDIINSTRNPIVSFLTEKSDLTVSFEIFNCLGNKIDGGTFKTKNKSKIDFNVPVGGLIRISPN